jgi:hypothetical protein
MHLDLPGGLSRKGKRLYTGRGKGLCTKGTASQAAENSEPSRKDVPQRLKPDIFLSFTARL